jgi:hypothetical protein
MSANTYAFIVEPRCVKNPKLTRNAFLLLQHIFHRITLLFQVMQLFACSQWSQSQSEEAKILKMNSKLQCQEYRSLDMVSKI